MNKFNIMENKEIKQLVSEDYNYVYRKSDGLFLRWGKTKEDDPHFSPIGPEILDLEISSGGECLGRCAFCYKGNGGPQPVYNMTLEEFKTLFDKMPKNLMQIAFGILNIHTNPDFFPMMEYAKENGVVPNYTCHGLDVDEEVAKKTAETCGAVAVSVYNKEKSYDAIKRFTDAGMSQVNIHFMVAEETYDRAFEIVKDMSEDPRLEKMNAIVFLQLKKKGSAVENDFNYLGSVEKYQKLIEYCNELGISYGFDSCSAPMLFKSIENSDQYDTVVQFAEPCESTLFSSYINYKGEFFPCSFAEGDGEWVEGIDALNCENFLKDVWHEPRVVDFRQRIIESSSACAGCKSQSVCRSCFIYPETAGCKSL